MYNISLYSPCILGEQPKNEFIIIGCTRLLCMHLLALLLEESILSVNLVHDNVHMYVSKPALTLKSFRQPSKVIDTDFVHALSRELIYVSNYVYTTFTP